MKYVTKKLVCLILAVMLPLSLVACGQTPANTDGNDPAVVEFVKENGDMMVDSFAGSFESGSGMKCDTTVRAEGSTIVMDCKIEGLDNIPAEASKQMQELFDAEKDTLKAGFDEIGDELPDSLTAFVINVCEEDGDKIAVIDIEF